MTKLFLSWWVLVATWVARGVQAQATRPEPGLRVFPPTDNLHNELPEDPPPPLHEPYDLPMRGMTISANIVDAVAEVAMVQEFVTPRETLPGVAVYRLPLFEQAAVTQFQARIGSRVIVGRVFEKEDARQQFEDAIDQGKTAFLAEQVTADVFLLTVGNLPPAQIIRVTLVYLTPLETLGATGLRFRLPTGIAPRYTPDGALTVPVEGDDVMENGVRIHLMARMSLPLVTVESVTHDIAVTGSFESGLAFVSVLSDPQERDLVVAFTLPATPEPQLYIEQSDEYNTMAMMLSIVPDLGNEGDEWLPGEYIFILDRSGSMRDKMYQIRQALREILLAVPAGSLYNIIGYGTSYAPLFDESRLIDSYIEPGLAYADAMQSDMGGTEILAALQFALGLPPNPDFQRNIFLFTDGEVSNTQDVINYVTNNLGNARIFTLGVGAHASTELVNGVARAGRGTSEFVDGTSAEAVTTAVRLQMEAASGPAFRNIQVDWGIHTENGSDSTQSPYLVPILANGKRFLIFLVTSIRTPPVSVSLTASISGPGELALFTVQQSDMVFLGDVTTEPEVSNTTEPTLPETNVTDSKPEISNSTDPTLPETNSTETASVSTKSAQAPNLFTNALVHKMAGRSMIRDLEEGTSALHEHGATPPEIQNKIVRLGILYQLASSHTSFLAIDESNAFLDSEFYFMGGEDDLDGRGAPTGGDDSGGVSGLIVAWTLFVMVTTTWLVMIWQV